MTFSIVARDPETGSFGVATATGGPSVGALVPHIGSGAGAIATQGDTNPLYGIDGLALLDQGVPAAVVVERLTSADPGRGRRQMIAIGTAGTPGTFSGAEVQPSAGIRAGADFAVAGNMLASELVLDAAARAFAITPGSFVDRLVAAMVEGERVGGDQRGTRSAALIVCSSRPYADIDCRVDFSDTPLPDLLRVVQLSRTGPYADFVATRPSRA